MRRRFYYMLVGVAMLMVGGCTNDEPKIDDNVPKMEEDAPEVDNDEVLYYAPLKLTDAQRNIKNAHNRFAFELMGKALETGAITGNDCISPVSLYQLLSMAANGDSGETAAQILKLILGEDKTLEQLNDFNKLVITGLAATDASVSVKYSNSVWLDKDLVINKDFAKKIGNFYKADSKSLALNTEEAKEQINEWCKTKTEGVINPFLDQRLSGVTVALLNATYFSGNWSEPFEKEITQSAEFHNVDGKVSTVDMMCQSAEMQYGEYKGAKVASKTFGEGNFEMVFILPAETADYKEFVSGLSSNYEALMQTMSSKTVVFRAPRFEAESSCDMTNLFKTIGLDKMYSRGFDQIIDNGAPLVVNTILHKVKFKVDESGAEGAAVSAILMDGACGMEDSDIKEITLNRPFIYLVRDRNSEVILFAGLATGF